MADAGNPLRIRFGLERNPSPDLQRLWAERTRAAIASGTPASRAGEQAAALTFPDYNRVVYASEGDTIEMLLQQIADK